MKQLISESIERHRQELDLFLGELFFFSEKAGNDLHRSLIADLRKRCTDPYLFVIVGEVKAGKSSFINALLATGEEICKVAPQPMTDCIQQVIYGETASTEQVNPFFRIIRQPVDILRHFAIVDTPGTNTIIEHHQEITERFIPAADLIVFVFEAKNPYRQSSWDFFKFIRDEWHKKVLFVLQQKDLLPEADLHINAEGVKKHAQSLGITQPLVFEVSAKDELDGHVETSGFSAVRNHIQHHVTGGSAPILKMESILSTAANLLQKMDQGIADRRKQWESDIAFRQRIHEALDQQSALSNTQVKTLIENISHSYQDIADQFGEELSQGLTFGSVLNRTIAGIFSKGATLKNWLEGLIQRLESTLQSDLKLRLDKQIVDVADRVQQMAKVVEYEMRKSPTLLPMDHDIYSNIAERRAQVLRELLESFTQFMQRSENFLPSDVFDSSKNLAPNVAAGSGVAVIGIVLAAVTQGMVFDITGGVLTGLGVLFAGITFGFQRRSILARYQEEMAKGRSHLNLELDGKLSAYVHTIRQRIESNFDSFDLLLASEEKSVLELESGIFLLKNRQKDQMQLIRQTLDKTTFN
jgi:hypothetical protein